MSDMRQDEPKGAPFSLVRIPGSPILRCRGDLNVATMEPLRRELALLSSAGHETLIVNFDGVRQLDTDAVLALVEASRKLAEGKGRLILVAARGAAASYLHLLGVDRLVSTCDTKSLALDLTDGGPEVGAGLGSGAGPVENAGTDVN